MFAKIGTSHKDFTISQYNYFWLLVIRGPTLSRSSCQSAGSTRRYDLKSLACSFSSSRINVSYWPNSGLRRIQSRTHHLRLLLGALCRSLSASSNSAASIMLC